METSLVQLHQKLDITATKKLALHLPHVHILGARHCGNLRQEAFKRLAVYHNFLCNRYYAELLVAIFTKKSIQILGW